MLPGQWSWEKALPPLVGKLSFHGRLWPPRLLGQRLLGLVWGEEEWGAGRSGGWSASTEDRAE